MAPALRVLIVDDQRLFAELIARILEEGSSPVQTSIAATVVSALQEVGDFDPDVILMDYLLPDGNGLEATKEILKSHPKARVLMLTGYSDPKLILEAIKIGCTGFLTKDEAIERVVAAVQSVASGEPVFSPWMLGQVAMSLKEEEKKPPLTSREVEVLQGLGFGHSIDQIADELSLSPHTIRNYIQSILMKLEVRSQLEAVVKAIRLKIIRAPVSN